MTVYVDTSALLRLVLAEAGALRLDVLRSCDRLVANELIAIEAARTIDRLRLQGALSAVEAAERIAMVNDWLEAIDLVLLRAPVLGRASEPFATPLDTLDAVHLATALVWRDRMHDPLQIATHDGALALAARAYSFTVIGA